MKFGSKKPSTSAPEKPASASIEVFGNAETVGRRMQQASYAHHDAAMGWLGQLKPAIDGLKVQPPYFANLRAALEFEAATLTDPKLRAAATKARDAFQAGMDHVHKLQNGRALSGEPPRTEEGAKMADRAAELVRVAGTMPIPALKAQIAAHENLLNTTQETANTSALRRELRSEIRVFRRALARREKTAAGSEPAAKAGAPAKKPAAQARKTKLTK